MELGVGWKMRPHLGPNYLTRDQGAGVVCGPERLPRPFAEAGVRPQDIEEDR